jgi:hypothetical protein
MKMFKKMKDEADDMLIDDLVGKCESKMISPMKKSKVEVEIEPKADGEEEGEEMVSENSLAPEDMQKLLDFYEQLKG